MSRLVPAPDALVGSRFDVAVSKMLGISRAKAADLIESGQARVLDRAIAKSGTLLYGETVEFDIAEERHEPEPVCLDMSIVYEDDDVVVVDKPVASLHMLRPDGQAPPYWAACSNAACASPHTELPGGRASCRGWMWARPA